MAYWNKGRGIGARSESFRGGMMGHFGPRAWRSDDNVFSCLADDDMDSSSDMEDDKSDKSESLLYQHQKKRKFNSSSGEGPRLMPDVTENEETDYLALNELPNDEKLTLILNKVCLYENRFRSLTSTLEGIAHKHKTVDKIESVVKSHGDRIRLLEYKSIDIEARSRRNNLLFYGLAEFRNENCSAVICGFIKIISILTST